MEYTKRINAFWAETTELPAGHANALSIHSFFHLFYVRRGSCTFICGNTSYEVSKGYCLLIPPHVYHEIPAELHTLMEFHEVKFEIIDPYLYENILKSPPVFFAGAFFDAPLAYICKNYQRQPDQQTTINIDCFLSALLTSMFLEHVIPQTPSSTLISGLQYNLTTRKTIEFIEKNAISGGFKLEDLGKELKLHPNYLSGNFRKDTGYTIIEYLCYVRISNAIRSMYFRSKTPLNEVALLCGFGSVSHFNRTFKKLTGTTPSILLAYLKQYPNESTFISKNIHDMVVLSSFPTLKEAFDKLHSAVQAVAATEKE